jgi:hypothetical protein
MKDNCYCCNCCTRVLVDLGADICPVCGFKGALSWIDGEPQEIDENEYKRKIHNEHL